MMSQHINSVLDHLRLGPLKKSPKDSIENEVAESVTSAAAPPPSDVTTTATAAVIKVNGNGYDVVDKISVVVINDEVEQKNAVKVTGLTMGSLEKFDPKKRYSIPAPNGGGNHHQHHENGATDPRHRSRELSPAAPRNMQRKLSQDLRFRGSNTHINEDAFELARLKRPVKLKSMTSTFETYDSLHTKAVEVSFVCLFNLK